MSQPSPADAASARGAAPPFAHLHCHTHYSLLDGMTKIPELVRATKEVGMNAAAITDHGNLYGAMEFYHACRAEDVNPILGIEAYMAPRSRTERGGRMKESNFHLTLLAQNATGFRNLVRMSSIAYTEGFYYKPRMDKELLKAHSEGLIVLSGCVSGELSRHLLNEQKEEAEELCKWYVETFGDRFYMEIQDSGIQIQKDAGEATIDLANKMGLPLVATNDSHYLCGEDAVAHDILLCVNTRSQRTDAKRMRLGSQDFYVKSPEEMYEVFPGQREAVRRSQEIADRCDIQLEKEPKYYPVFKPPRELTDTQYLREICERAMAERYGDEATQEHRDRLDLELGVIEHMGYSSYFLIVWDFVEFAKREEIPCTARGSAAGAIVAYLLGISDVCPLKYDLLFERFLDKSRKEPPDIDIDFCRDRRQLVIDYTKEKYGEESVAQIGTFGTLKAKAVVRDVGRALGVPLSRVNEIAKAVPDTLGISLADAVKQSPELGDAYNNDPQITELIDIAYRLEGLARSAGTHAAGVVVADQPLMDLLPLQVITGKEDVITQWDGPTVEAAGLLKMDFLGLRNLTILDKAVRNVKKHRGVEIVPRDLPLDDKPTFALLQRGETKGVFQLESGGMRDLLTKMRPDKFADVIATSALYRPGPLEGGMVMDYVNVKNGRQQPAKVHPIVDDVLEETYGVMVYQEQVMRILNRVGGIELASAYKCIKAISKKKLPIIAQYRQEYIDGAKSRGMDVQVAENLFGLIEKFAGYGFNKCVVGETEVLHAETGERTTVGDLFRDRRPFAVHALNDCGELRPQRVTDVVWNGRKPTFELRTDQGKRLMATANHPVRTFDGWTNLGDLKPGDRVAAPRRLTVSDGGQMPRHELTVLAGLIAEGNTCHPSCLYFYNDRRDLIGDFIDAARQFPDTAARLDVRGDGKRMEVCLSTGRDARFKPGAAPWNAPGGGTAVAAPARSGAFLWAQRLGLLGKKAAEKFVPAPVFALCDDDLAFFLGRMWAGDGFVGSVEQTPFYATSSGRLARDVRTLLLRLGIVAGVRSKTFRYRYKGAETPRAALTVHLVGNDAIAGFTERVLPHALGRETQVAAFREAVAARAEGMTSKDTVPAEVRGWVAEERVRAGLTWRQLQERSGICVKEFVGRGSAGKRGFRRSTVAKLAAFFASDRLAETAGSDLFWDTVVSVEPRGVRDTYDLTVEEDHNFVADGLVVHNSHSTAYGAIAYQTAYLKAHYPPEFMAALLSCGMESSDRITEHVEDARRMGLEVLPPDVNRSDVEFSVVPLNDENGEEKAGITFGLGAVKGLGLSAMHALVEEREAHGPYKDLFDITERVDPQYLNRSALDILIKCGALDSLGPSRAQHAAVTDRAVQAAANKARDAAAGQASLFGEEDEADAPEIAASFPDVPDWTRAVKLAGEKEVFGFYLTSHPLTEAGDVITKFATATTRDLGEAEDGVEVTVGGMVGAIKKARTKKPSRNGNSDYVMFDFEDAEGCVRCIMWPEEFARQGEKVEQEAVLYVKGKVDRRGREPNLIVNRLMTPDEAIKEHTRQLAVKFQKGLHAESDLSRVREILGRYPGETDVVVLIDTGSAEALNGPDGEADGNPETAAVRTRYRLSTPGHLRVSCGPGLRRELTEVMGEAHLHFWSPPVRRKTGSPSLN